MDLHVANPDDLISVLDRVLDKGIVVDSWVLLTPHGIEPVFVHSPVELDSAAVYVGYGSLGKWQEITKTKSLFPFWRREFWTK